MAQTTRKTRSGPRTGPRSGQSLPPAPGGDFPSREEILAFIRESPVPVGKREIAKAFRITGNARIVLKNLLKDLETDGSIDRGRGRKLARPGALPEVMVVEVTGIDSDGETLARPLNWPGQQDGFEAPKVVLVPERGFRTVHRGASPEAPGVGERCLVRLARIGAEEYEGRVMKRLRGKPQQVLGVLSSPPERGNFLFRLSPTDKKDKNEYNITSNDTGESLASGDLVLAEVLPGKHLGLPHARIVEAVGNIDQPRAFSLIAIHSNGIPDVFSEEAVAIANSAEPVTVGHGEDIRHIPLITIDGEDARDFDDAVRAEPDEDPENPGGFRLMVAIADVSWYVRPGSALDRDAYERGNSVYFPDRVVPMLPEALSNGLCSLRPEEERGCLAVEIVIDADGNKKHHRFLRGLMRSAARLTYDQVQKARDGFPDEATAPLVEPVITPLYEAFAALERWRKKRGTLELDLPERKVQIGEDGKVASIVARERFDSHRLIEEFMILANVCAAETLEKKKAPCMYRVHDSPSPAKIEALRSFLHDLDYSVGKGDGLRPQHFNQILEKAKGEPEYDMINQLVLRSQAQAVYSPENLGHFGLSLQKYAHFTSPIRRYSDLLVHRALVSCLTLGEGGLPEGTRISSGGSSGARSDRRSGRDERGGRDPRGGGDPRGGRGGRDDGHRGRGARPLQDSESAAKSSAKSGPPDFETMGEHISATERRAALAEREATERYCAAYMAERVGAEFAGRVSGVGRFGLFVRLTDSGAEGLIPMGQLPGDYYEHDEDSHSLIGRSSRHVFRLADLVQVRLLEAEPVTGRMLFHLLDGGTSVTGSSALPKPKQGRGRPQRRPGGPARSGEAARHPRLKSGRSGKKPGQARRR